MLSFFRRGATEKVMLGVLLIALIAIVITGFGTQGMGGIDTLGGGGDTLVKVGGERVTGTEVRQQVERQLSRIRQQQPEVTAAQFLANGTFEEMIRQLIAQKALIAFAHKQGMGVSRQMVDSQIAAIPAFHNLAGQFDPNAFKAALDQARITEEQLRREMGEQALQQQLFTPIAGGGKVPEEMAHQYASLLLEQRTGTIGVVPAAAMSQGKEPTDQEVAAFYQQNGTRYAVPERRIIRYAAFDRSSLPPVSVTPAEIETFYKANQDKYGASESRTLLQVVLPDQKAAQAFAAKVAGGTSFAAAAQAAGFAAADISIGAQTKPAFAKLSAPAVADAAFAAAEGGTTQPVQSPLGWYVVHVDKITRNPGKTLAAATDEIKKQLEDKKAQDALGEKVNRVEDKVADGASLQEIVKDEHLTIAETPAVTGSGAQPDKPGAAPDPAIQPLLQPAFEMQPGDDPEVQALVPGQKFAVFDVSRVIAAAPPPLAQVTPQVKADLIRQRAAERARAVAEAIVAKINGGTPPQQAFAQAGIALPPPQTATLRRMDVSRGGGKVPPPLALLFSLPVGHAQLMPAPNGQGWLVVASQQSVRGDASGTPQLIDATRSQFKQIIGDEYAAEFVQAVEKTVKVRRNDSAIAKLKADLIGGTAQ